MRGRSFVALVLTVVGSFATAADDRDTSWIRTEYRAIRQGIENYHKTEEFIVGRSSEGALATAYQNAQGEVRLIDVTYYGEMGRTRYELYYDGGQAFFALKQDYAYNAPFYMSAERTKEEGLPNDEAFDNAKTVLEEHRYYFGGDRLIRYIGPNPASNSDSFSSEETGEQIRNHAHELLSLFRP